MDAINCRKILDNTQRQLMTLRDYNKDLIKMYKNLEKMINEISKLEVDCRRKKNFRPLQPPLKSFTEGVDRLEKLILIAKLIE